MDAKKFRMYIIKCTATGHCYINYTGSQDLDFKPISYISRTIKTNNDKYKKLAESFKTHGIKKHRCIVYKEMYTKEEVEDKAYKVQSLYYNNNPDKYLNDLPPISPEKETCDFCGKKYRMALRDIHLEKYCDSTVFQDENELFNMSGI